MKLLRFAVLLIWALPFCYALGHISDELIKIFPNPQFQIICGLISVSLGGYIGWSLHNYVEDKNGQ